MMSLKVRLLFDRVLHTFTNGKVPPTWMAAEAPSGAKPTKEVPVPEILSEKIKLLFVLVLQTFTNEVPPPTCVTTDAPSGAKPKKFTGVPLMMSLKINVPVLVLYT